MKMYPNYSTYTDKELLEAMSSIDRLKYPDNFSRLQLEISKRKSQHVELNKVVSHIEKAKPILTDFRIKYFFVILASFTIFLSAISILNSVGKLTLIIPFMFVMSILSKYVFSWLLSYRCFNCGEAAFYKLFSFKLPMITGHCPHCGIRIP